MKRYTELKRKKRLRSNGKEPMTGADRIRVDRVKRCGCIACLKRGELSVEEAAIVMRNNPTNPDSVQAHHMLDDGGRRMGHQFTYALCRWHHLGDPPGDMSKTDATWRYGPALALGTVPFYKEYGTDDELLEYQNRLLIAVYGES